MFLSDTPASSWPTGVTSWHDTVKIAQLIFGTDVVFQNFSHKLPKYSERSFLLFAKGACGEGKPLHGVADLIVPQMQAVSEYEASVRYKPQNPRKVLRCVVVVVVVFTIGLHN